MIRLGKLDKYARQSKAKEPSKVLPIRLPESIYEQFRQRCEELGLSMSEAGYLLIKEELEDGLYNASTNEVAATTQRIQNRIHRENTSYTKENTDKSPFFLLGGRQLIMKLKTNYLVLYVTNGIAKRIFLGMPKTIVPLLKSF